MVMNIVSVAMSNRQVDVGFFWQVAPTRVDHWLRLLGGNFFPPPFWWESLAFFYFEKFFLGGMAFFVGLESTTTAH